MYAFPMSISTAMAIVVSYEVGAKRLGDAKKYIKIGRLSAMAFAILTLSFLYVFRENVASLYGHVPEFIQLTASFMTYSLFFQLADTFAAPLQGILRGYKDTVIPFYLGLLGYWGVAIPLGLFSRLFNKSRCLFILDRSYRKFSCQRITLSVAFTSYYEKIQIIC